MHKKISLKTWLTLLFVSLSVVLATAFILVGRYAQQTMRRNAVSFNENLIQVYMQGLDTSIDGVNRFLSCYAASQEAISVLARSTDESERYFAVQDITRQLQNGVFLYDNFNGLFVYSQGPNENIFLYQMKGRGSLASAKEIQTIISGSEAMLSTNGWQAVDTEDTTYLIQTVRTGNTSCGAWIDIEELVLPMENIQLGKNGRVFFLDREGVPLPYCNGQAALPESGTVMENGIPYLCITRDSTQLPIRLAVLIPETEFTRDIRMQKVSVEAICMILLCLPMMWYALRRLITVPVKRLTCAMRQVELGDLTVQAKQDEVLAEFAVIAAQFNHMVRQIDRLQKDAFQRQIQVQKTNLQYLQMQIRPHFFLNALNTLYANLLIGQHEVAEQLTLCLSRYFRYMLGSSAAFVPLRQELAHVSNYMEIQQLRSEGRLRYIQEVEQTLYHALVPPLVVQTFVENSIKYGASSQNCLEISVFAEPVAGPCQQLRIVICDNGKGYQPAMLERFQQKQPPAEGATQGIGIENVRQRLQLTYGEAASLVLGNSPDGGAQVELLLPLQIEEETEAEKNDPVAGG